MRDLRGCPLARLQSVRRVRLSTKGRTDISVAHGLDGIRNYCFYEMRGSPRQID